MVGLKLAALCVLADCVYFLSKYIIYYSLFSQMNLALVFIPSVKLFQTKVLFHQKPF